MANPMPSGVSATSTRDAGSIRAEWNAGSSSFSHASGLMRRGVGAVIDQQWASAESSRALSWVPQRSRGGSAALPWRGRLPDRRQRLAPSARPLWRGEPPPRRSRTLRQTTAPYGPAYDRMPPLGKARRNQRHLHAVATEPSGELPTHRMCSSSSHEWDTEAFGATYPASLSTPAPPLYGSEWCQKAPGLASTGITVLTIYLQIPRK
jgi:hypothetical protein